ncbi:2-amino-4,5-dihydroxy-6-oxo-7-(phosphonooxy)heptanoate synthase [Streptomyces sp. SAI-208]|uniref:2-amino-3,7-dideoxy-D-threo-hept-6-ulosonate synthase n=1 Tax=unclassified Streptomyces TaxID=2593676 RepID=UPI002476FB0D|nr:MULTISPECIES: 2-amino-3,7-dideoxy-D-threo-hept-6-ulosonate synthase [unclassified Streptomyces]MDH6515155.1 2-amino-4,5-dihydroxy-6-oxo-7-(phosphonooxy)heptanoate synthase [Streptomyces sp. SAI-090]MDH6547369.1 2-amino-4,5-dihydroxy-6-oxo-7-(phosphonooxy)heptanoate synthase [Streptomyces sp. SAI-041]MDH6588610.1 2-amino-4,5-dihydroxy-6-oxo-7-(phosphonooxy)heptanoate synthase [Streptomyces sp. SAI-133]MDH6605999.1 2-amino-4,5-dihydroxy-6-oxo-7-(phosphonooxy)heptanoate synthase [Streptomyces s
MTARSDGLAVRLARLSRHRDGRFLFVPMDHSVADGPIVDAARFNGLVGDVVAGGADAIVVHKGRARTVDPRLLRECALVVHLSASTPHALDGDAKVLVGDVEEAVRLGADAVSVHVNIGSDSEAAQLSDLGSVAEACQRWNVPLLAMAYPRGPRVTDPHDPALLAHVVNVAADLGATLVKTSWPRPFERLAEIVESCPIPVLLAGGPAGTALNEFAAAAMAAGAGGLAVGRGVFQHPEPVKAVRELASVIHGLPDSAELLTGRVPAVVR